MSYDFRFSIARFFRLRDKQVVGEGFVAKYDELTRSAVIVTCAQVIRDAMEISEDEMQQKPSEVISVDFPFLEKGVFFKAHIIHWYPTQPDGTGNIAALEVLGEAPTGLAPAKLVADYSYSDHGFRAYGFPTALEREGRRVEGKLQGRLLNGNIQAIGTTDLGYYIDAGFTGTPVWDTELQGIVGIIAKIDTLTQIRVAFIIPVDAIAAVFPEFHYTHRSPKTIDNVSSHVFLSYATNDGSEYVKRLHDDLEADGISTWLDKQKIKPGSEWDNAIDLGLKNARAIVVILTPGSILSIQVKSEWNDGLNRLIPVIPLLFEDCEVPRVLKTLNYIDFRENYDRGIAQLKRRLGSLEDDHLSYLQSLLTGYQSAQQHSNEPNKFSDKIDHLQVTIATWNRRAGIQQEKLSEQHQRVAEGLQDMRAMISAEAVEDETPEKITIAGQLLKDVSVLFKDRHEERKQLLDLIGENRIRVISILGRGGIGKTALVSKLLNDIQRESPEEHYTKLQIKGVAFLSTRSKGISLERIFITCAEMLGDDTEKELLGVWTDANLTTEEKTVKLLRKMAEGIYIIILDNVEDLLDSDGHFVDDELRTAFEVSLRIDHKATIVLTSRVPLAFPPDLISLNRQLVLEDGLPEADAVEMLRELDANGEYGVRDAPYETVSALAKKLHGVPRALEIAISILANDPFTSIDDLLANQLYENEEFVEQMVRDNYRLLDSDARHVLDAMSIFSHPVPLLAVDYLLEPFVAGIDVQEVVKRLVQMHTIYINRKTKEISLHPIDRDYIYSQIPDALDV